ncbi:excisionase family DNA-binding protein [Segatella bryantii]|uniref:Helix-turn-helix domain-containing protein n=1 Tax=Segatella bryantii TaxID=77095 RepID=A0ABX4EH04_SEGBR|nr:excisionase family DNA-binding protein [Segatella bryantii]OYP54603.1 hypothetical protein CIK91_08810 [Segatella bryantii]UKK82118.1 excisionase family DNA-binding protein [Segatella bryantii]
MTTTIVNQVEKIWLSTDEVLKYLGIKKDFLDRLREEGKIPYYKPAGKKQILFNKHLQ